MGPSELSLWTEPFGAEWRAWCTSIFEGRIQAIEPTRPGALGTILDRAADHLGDEAAQHEFRGANGRAAELRAMRADLLSRRSELIEQATTQSDVVHVTLATGLLQPIACPACGAGPSARCRRMIGRRVDRRTGRHLISNAAEGSPPTSDAARSADEDKDGPPPQSPMSGSEQAPSPQAASSLPGAAPPAPVAAALTVASPGATPAAGGGTATPAPGGGPCSHASSHLADGTMVCLQCGEVLAEATPTSPAPRPAVSAPAVGAPSPGGEKAAAPGEAGRPCRDCGAAILFMGPPGARRPVDPDGSDHGRTCAARRNADGDVAVAVVPEGDPLAVERSRPALLALVIGEGDLGEIELADSEARAVIAERVALDAALERLDGQYRAMRGALKARASALERYDQALLGWIERTAPKGKQSVDVLEGRASWRRVPARPEVVDEGACLNWAREHATKVWRVRESIDVRELSNEIGRCPGAPMPPGVVLRPERRSVCVSESRARAELDEKLEHVRACVVAAENAPASEEAIW